MSGVYTVYIDAPSKLALYLVDFRDGVDITLERVEGAWQPIEDWVADDLNGRAILRVGDDFLPVWDRAEVEDRDLTWDDVVPFSLARD